jgi:hypothetical protein
LELGIDPHRRGHSRREHLALGHLIDADAHWNPLRQAHPSEDLVDVGQPLPVGLRVRNVDARAMLST